MIHCKVTCKPWICFSPYMRMYRRKKKCAMYWTWRAEKNSEFYFDKQQFLIHYVWFCMKNDAKSKIDSCKTEWRSAARHNEHAYMKLSACVGAHIWHKQQKTSIDIIPFSYKHLTYHTHPLCVDEQWISNGHVKGLGKVIQLEYFIFCTCLLLDRAVTHVCVCVRIGTCGLYQSDSKNPEPWTFRQKVKFINSPIFGYFQAC